ncbi:hypothetical protein [Streptomyces acidiscabies]|uniref:Uncharacterized protein n=1 Tax=Streptomyces acidiscabies TaxID=42234 RepID=A0AAP6EFC9_9ACTN|nr:hypothetical protein [Streptomyces acidiscabies]MBP5936324.1 hypothetical protein [Streptomyces sp. LBUM 1476]MBZ3915719.1 hypothetical protein [Streptomyces acidiscabies]MDX2960125.1 hypothetical protein [Streptomyces acidiscabies]MDX3019476.1 hypothetical protein [Streptomyces acidiscabies]MDX3793125.1 hypothetical protein [Streptomyces acidiscabies]
MTHDRRPRGAGPALLTLVLFGLLGLGWAVSGLRPVSVEAPRLQPRPVSGDGVFVVRIDVVAGVVVRPVVPGVPEGRFPSPSPLSPPVPPE